MSESSLLAQAALEHGARAVHDWFSPAQRIALRYCWRAWRRPLGVIEPGKMYRGQVAPPGRWGIWLFRAGRGSGKTRTGAEWIREEALKYPGIRCAMVGETADEARKVMLNGESGLLNCFAPWEGARFHFTDQMISLPNESLIFLMSSEKPEKFRGPQFHRIWLDELPKWKRVGDTWNQIKFCNRLPIPGDRPRMMISTTPRPSQLLKSIANRSDTVITIGSTYDNAANLDDSFLEEMRALEGTSFGRQEIFGEQFDEASGAIFKLAWIETHRTNTRPPMVRIVVAVDPTSSRKKNSDLAGIVVAGLADNGRVYVLQDASMRSSPEKWGRRAIEMFHRWGADCVVCETTMGGELVPTTLRLIDPNVPVKIKGGNRNKVSRAEPVAVCYEQGKVSHLGLFSELEDEMVNYVLGSSESPDRMDAMVYAVSELLGLGTESDGAAYYGG